MDRNQIHKDRDNLIDSYIRNELSDQETDFFEEHLLFCKECRDALSQRNRMVESIQNLSAQDAFQAHGRSQRWSGKRLKIVAYVAAAAGVALVVGLFLFSKGDHPSRSSPQLVNETEIDKYTLGDPEVLMDEKAGQGDSGEEDIQKSPGSRISYLSEYQANPLYENQIGVHYRSGSLRVEAPSDSVECLTSSSIEFRYQGAGSDSLFLVLLNRHGEILSEEMIHSPHTLEFHFPAGLYYWQLCNEEECLHTAKIFVRPRN